MSKRRLSFGERMGGLGMIAALLAGAPAAAVRTENPERRAYAHLVRDMLRANNGPWWRRAKLGTAAKKRAIKRSKAQAAMKAFGVSCSAHALQLAAEAEWREAMERNDPKVRHQTHGHVRARWDFQTAVRRIVQSRAAA